jgi:hypothetical protein
MSIYWIIGLCRLSTFTIYQHLELRETRRCATPSKKRHRILSIKVQYTPSQVRTPVCTSTLTFNLCGQTDDSIGHDEIGEDSRLRGVGWLNSGTKQWSQDPVFCILISICLELKPYTKIINLMVIPHSRGDFPHISGYTHFI